MKNRKNYPADWFDRIRPDILRRDNYRCIKCKAQNHKKGYYNESGAFVQCDEHMLDWAQRQGIKTITVHLQIAHLNQDVTDNNYENLAAMCPKHHLKHDHDYKKHLRRAKRK